MARRIATVGYYVMLPNLYYRSGVEELGVFIGEGAAETRKQMFALMASLTIPLVMDDTDALIAFADADAAAAKGPMGTVGYCMSGRYALSAAVRHPDRVVAAASIYGVSLITEEPDSPHKTLAGSKAGALRRLGRDRPLCAAGAVRTVEGRPRRSRARRRGRTLSQGGTRFRLPRPPRLRQGGGGTPLGAAIRPVWEDKRLEPDFAQAGFVQQRLARAIAAQIFQEQWVAPAPARRRRRWSNGRSPAPWDDPRTRRRRAMVRSRTRPAPPSPAGRDPVQPSAPPHRPDRRARC